jgi:hypothetical protein
MAWTHHAVNAARIIELHDPQNFATDFEKALLMTHASPIVSSDHLP